MWIQLATHSVLSAHTFFVRGIFNWTRILSKQKRVKTLSDLLAQLHVLEKKHKNWTDLTTEADLLKETRIYRWALFLRSKTCLVKGPPIFLWVRRQMQLLAGQCLTKQTISYIRIHFVLLGLKIHATPDLAKAFRNVYSTLYSLTPTSSSSPSSTTLSDVMQ